MTSTSHWQIRVSLCSVSQDDAPQAVIDQLASSRLSFVMFTTVVSYTSGLLWIKYGTKSLFAPYFAFTDRGTHRVSEGTRSNDIQGTHTYVTFAEKMRTHSDTQTRTHDCSQTQTSACVLSVAALVHWNTAALALRSAVRHTLLGNSDWDTHRDPVLSLRLPYKEAESRLRQSSSVLLMLNLQSVLSLFCHWAPSASDGFMRTDPLGAKVDMTLLDEWCAEKENLPLSSSSLYKQPSAASTSL